MRNEGSFSGHPFFRLGTPSLIVPSGGEHLSIQPLVNKSDCAVLIFSAEKDTRLLFRILLQIWGYPVEESACLEESLIIIKNRRPELILMDLISPFEADLEIIRQIRQNEFCKDLPIVLISGFSHPKFRDLTLALGADEYFVKPVDFDSLEKC